MPKDPDRRSFEDEAAKPAQPQDDADEAPRPTSPELKRAVEEETDRGPGGAQP